MPSHDYAHILKAHCGNFLFLTPRGNDEDGKALFWCELCGKMVRADQVHPHCADASHRTTWQGATNVQNSPLAFGFINLHSRIEQLGSNWQTEIKAQFYNSFLQRDLMGHSFDSAGAIKEANELVNLYESRERVALLELAVWKAICVAKFQPKQIQGYHEWLAWTWHGWKSEKSKTQGCNEISIVIAAVRPFIDSTISTM
jgi:hypothetical protein